MRKNKKISTTTILRRRVGVLEDVIAKNQETIGTMSQEAESLRAEVARLSDMNQSLVKQIANLQGSNTAHAEARLGLVQRLRDMTEDSEKVSRKLVSAEQEIAGVKQTNLRLESENERLHAILTAANVEKKAVSQAYQEALRILAEELRALRG